MALFLYLKMATENYFQLGLITKLHSFKGEVILHIDADDPSIYFSIKHLFIQINNRLIPYIIKKSIVHKNNQLRLQLEGIINQEDASLLLKNAVFLPLEQLPKLNKDQFYYHEIIGYQLIDSTTNTKVGSIVNVIDHPGNTLIEAESDCVEIIVPMNDATFEKIEKSSKKLFLKVPEGLLDIYLEDER